MSTDTTLLAFHLTGRREGAGLEAHDPLEYRPALFASYGDLPALRHDFPVVLTAAGGPEATVEPLSGVFDDLLRRLAGEREAERLSAHLLRLEHEIRVRVAQGATGTLAELWDDAAGRLGSRGDAALRDSLERGRAALDRDGELAGCDHALPGRFLRHAWGAARAERAARFHERRETLVARLEGLLRADFDRSPAGRTPERLAASVGALHRDTFDFDALSRVLTGAVPVSTLGEARRARIRGVIETLRHERFHADWAFEFESAEAALRAWRERLPHLLEVTRALAMADLEVRNEYVEARHDAFFARRTADDLTAEERAAFPDYWVRIGATKLGAVEQAALLEALEDRLPFKVLVQHDDLSADLAAGVGVRSRQLSTLATGLHHVFVLQLTSSQMVHERDRVTRGFGYDGPALFNVHSGAGPSAGPLPAYLMAASAAESRAFPAMVYDPSAGPDWASRCDLEANPQVERDWPVHTFQYEDADHQRCTEDVAFTLVDYLACDPRHAAHFALLPASGPTEGLVPVGDVIASPPAGDAGAVPFIWLVDAAHRLRRAVVDDRLVREARRCRERWHSLQELGGIHNSHAERVLARERREAEARARVLEPVGAAAPVAAAPLASAPETVVAEPAPPAAPERASGEPWIETPRCSTCNECIQLNGRMFAYNENRQAYIKDPRAGTYRQLVEAAESCQVAIIHPGRPLDPNEPGLDELLERAAAFD